MSSGQWSAEYSEEVSLKLSTEFGLRHARQGGVQGSIIESFITKADYHGLVSFELDYTTGSLAEIRHCRQALAYFTKAPFLPLKVDRQQVARLKFEEAQQKCRLTNESYRAMRDGRFKYLPSVNAVMLTASRKISRVLGKVPKLSDLFLKFGPGATTRVRKQQASIRRKLDSGMQCSESLFPCREALLEEIPVWAEAQGRNVDLDVGVLEFVPKDAKTDRSIVKEPSLNVLVQSGIGQYIADRLARVGVNIRDRDINRNYARVGSIDGSLSTIDLSSASDTIAWSLVMELLPLDWYVFLDSSRTHKVQDRGNRQPAFEAEMFSSMGNGFTFPLETLIFWALATASTESDFASVFGDDIIVRSEETSRVVATLTASGFKVNESKSFTHGPFRESCGGDYYLGTDIRPLYIKSQYSQAVLFKAHNFYIRSGDPVMAQAVMEHIDPDLAIYGPDGFGDGHLLGDWTPMKKKAHKARSFGGVTFDTYQFKPRRDEIRGREERLAALYHTYAQQRAYVDILPPIDPAVVDPHGLARLYGRKRKFSVKIAPDELPERKSPVGLEPTKLFSLPGTWGYRKLSVYTFHSK